jgi:hypothetical protein
MVKTRLLFWILLACALLAASAALSQTTLTQIRDTVVNTDGTPFNGTVVITWNGPTGSDVGTSPLSTSARIYNGALSVLLVPTTTASSSAFYQAVYYNTNGASAWVETWQVPASNTPLTLSLIRTSTSPGGSGSSIGNGSSGGVQYATLPVALNQVSGLSAALASINNAIATLTSQLGTAGSSNSNAAFVDAETPAGTFDGANTTFTLSKIPFPASSLAVYRNGVLQTLGVDYTVSGATVTFLAGSAPKASDLVSTYYRVSGVSTVASFVDFEVPAGTIDGNNLTFTLANAPLPVLSLKLSKNGVLLTPNNDYTLSGQNILFPAGQAPQVGDMLVAAYRR